MAFRMPALLPLMLGFASTGSAAIAWEEEAARLVPSDLHVLQNNRAADDAHISSIHREAPEALSFDVVPLVRTRDAGNTDKRVAALGSYFRYKALPLHIELVEDNRTEFGSSGLSVCFSQAVNGVRIYNTAACGIVEGSDLTFEHHALVRPPGVDTKARIKANEALQVVAMTVPVALTQKTPWVELNVVFVDDRPILCWRVVACDDETTYFVDAHDGMLLARTHQSYRPTCQLSDCHCGRST